MHLKYHLEVCKRHSWTDIIYLLKEVSHMIKTTETLPKALKDHAPVMVDITLEDWEKSEH